MRTFLLLLSPLFTSCCFLEGGSLCGDLVADCCLSFDRKKGVSKPVAFPCVGIGFDVESGYGNREDRDVGCSPPEDWGTGVSAEDALSFRFLWNNIRYINGPCNGP